MHTSPNADSPKWYIRTQLGETRGPFTTSQVKEFKSSGRINENTPISRNPTGVFQPLSQVLNQSAPTHTPPPIPLQVATRNKPSLSPHFIISVAVSSCIGLIAAVILVWSSMNEDSPRFQNASEQNKQTPESVVSVEERPQFPSTTTPSEIGNDNSLITQAPNPHIANPPAPSATQAPVTFEEVVALTEGAVCLIRGGVSGGSGFLIAPDFVMTNRHVVDSMLVDEIGVLFPSDQSLAHRALEAKIIYEDPKLDVAILKIPPVKIRPLEIDSETRDVFRRGRDIIAIGSPGVINGTLANAVSQGLLSSQTTIDNIEYYQTSMSVNPGNSGGPILALNGKVLGMITLKDPTVEGIAFAIPAHSLLEILNSPGNEFKTLAGEPLAQLNKEHDARTIVNRITLLLVASSMRLESIVNNIHEGIEEQNFDADQAFEYAIELDNGNREQRLDTLESITAPTIPKISSSKLLSESVRLKIAELWSLYREVRSYADSPRGSANSMRQKYHELRDKWIRLRNELGALLDITVP